VGERIFALGMTEKKLIGFLIKMRITYIHVQGKSVVNSSGNDNHVAALNFYANPTFFATGGKGKSWRR
jgi:hypothetical protein